MIFVNYLSTKDRERLKAIEAYIQESTSVDDRAELIAKREKIEAKRKPLHACSIEECMELSHQLSVQLQQHSGLGNRTQVKLFQSMIEGVFQRSAALHAEMSKAALEKTAELEKKNRISVDDDDEFSKDKKSRSGSKKRTASNRWTISVDKFD